MDVWVHACGFHVAKEAKENSSRSPIMRLIHHLFVFTICHWEESDKVPILPFLYVLFDSSGYLP